MAEHINNSCCVREVACSGSSGQNFEPASCLSRWPKCFLRERRWLFVGGGAMLLCKRCLRSSTSTFESNPKSWIQTLTPSPATNHAGEGLGNGVCTFDAALTGLWARWVRSPGLTPFAGMCRPVGAGLRNFCRVVRVPRFRTDFARAKTVPTGLNLFSLEAGLVESSPS